MDKKRTTPPVRKDTLDALKNLDNSEPQLPASADDPRSATGFVAMLAQGHTQPDVFSPLGSILEADTKASRGNIPPPRPQPMAQPKSRNHLTAEIPEAKIIEPRANQKASVPAAPAAPRPKAAQAHEWYRLAVPLMLVMGSLLVLLGFWAVASLAGMPNALIPHDHYGSRYHAAISLAWKMLIALPIGAMLDAMAVYMLIFVRKHHRK